LRTLRATHSTNPPGASRHAALDAIERHLATAAFLVADSYTIADIALYAYTHVADEGASI
jgi:glutathione S-transferase